MFFIIFDAQMIMTISTCSQMAAILKSAPKMVNRELFGMEPYQILIRTVSSTMPETLMLLTESEQLPPKSAHIRPTIMQVVD